MKFNKQIIIILVLLSLLLSALGAAFYFYTQNNKSIKSNEQLRIVYIASRDIKINNKITKNDIKQTQIAKKYILTTPLLKKEIIGKFAKENIYKNDTFRKEKLIKEVLVKKKVLLVDAFKLNSYNIKFKLFENPNYSIQKGDIINIISVYPKTAVINNSSPNKVQYVASNIKVLGFLLKGKETAKALQEITEMVKNKKTKKQIPITKIVKSSEIILDIDSKVLLSLIDDYNRGKQLWMVKTKLKIKKPIVKPIKKTIVSKKVRKKAKKSYPIKLYTSKDNFNKLQATIHYADDKDAATTKNKTIKISKIQQCKDSDMFLIGISNKVHLRLGASNGHKIARIVYRNYIIPYNSYSNGWYKTCDGYYIYKSEVKSISKKIAFTKLGKLK